MRKFWRRVLVVLFLLTVVGISAVMINLRQPVFGQLPEGERIAYVQASPNYRGDAFQNLSDTPFLTNGATQWSIRKENFFADEGMPRPLHDLPTRKTDLRALDPQEDLAIWLGHSSWYVQLGGKRILLDPVFSDHAAPLPGVVKAFSGTSIYSVQDMPPIDLLLISHDHYDHLDHATILALRPLVKEVAAGLGIGAHFELWGYNPANIHELDWYDSVELGKDVRVHVTPARHYSGRTLTRNQSLWVGFALESAQRRLFFSGDSGYGAHFADIGNRYGPFDWVTLDSGQYDPRWANLHMNPEEAARAASDLGARALTPSHVGRFTLASHDWNDPFKRLVHASEGRPYGHWIPMIGQPVLFDGRDQSFEPWWNNVD
ncbi:MBL fold metallo-hydrolase [Pseudomonas sp.]|uniref:MBL fold metallo-hydrolase n=1 Tax=Pseudomonas sp. TaxID=306 RepID=UPI002FC79AAB